MKITTKVRKLAEELTLARAQVRRERYLRDMPKSPATFNGLLLTRRQQTLVNNLAHHEQVAYASYLKTPPTIIRRWAMETLNVPRGVLNGATAYRLQLEVQYFHHRRFKWFVKQIMSA